MHELRDLFTETPEGLASSQTQEQLHELHAAQREHGPGLTEHIKWLRTVEGFAGEVSCPALGSIPLDGATPCP